MNDKCIHTPGQPTTLYLGNNGTLACWNCSMVWFKDPEPEWPKVVDVSKYDNLFVLGADIGLSEVANRKFQELGYGIIRELSINQDGTFEILSVDGRKLVSDKLVELTEAFVESGISYPPGWLTTKITTELCRLLSDD